MDLVDVYLSEVQEQLATGHAVEHAYRPALQRLMEAAGQIRAVNDPKRSEHGAPDFIFLDAKNQDVICGYAEAKDIGVSLDKTESSKQMQRYAGYGNLFLTDYLEFRFFRNGVKYQTVAIAELEGGRLVKKPEAYQLLWGEFEAFLAQPPETITDGARLAQIMGSKAQRIRANVERYLQEESEKNSELLRIYELIKRMLVHDLDPASFADMYAQTLVYGLFAARYNDDTPESFTRAEARDLVPVSNPFLREFFDHIAGSRFDQRLAYIVDELCEIFAVSDVLTIVHKHLKVVSGDSDDKDPIIHFYEDFLKSYDAQQRKQRGAYYTPLPVVRYMVRMVDHLLKSEFGLADGLADTSKQTHQVVLQGKKTVEEYHRVQVLDPAVGTATFLNEVVRFLYKRFESQAGMWPSYVVDHLIPRLHGFELMMAPYTVAHLKLALTLSELGVEDFKGRRLSVYLANALEPGHDFPQDLFAFGLADAVAQEAVKAGEIKNERPIMVVLGNPPYSGVSANESPAANQLIDRYKVEPGGQQKLQERKHWLNDDYVKFIAFAEQMVEKNQTGIVALITNHGYLDNPTFRGMRWRLAETFDKIYVLDLHGNAKKKEVAPDGGKDENVFDIQQGVAIIFGVLKGQKQKSQLAEVHHAELYGRRAEKFQQLAAQDLGWQQLTLAEPMHYFVPKNLEGQEAYGKGVAIDKLFQVNSTGIVTMGDGFILDESKDALKERVQKLIGGEFDESSLRNQFRLGKNYPSWVLESVSQLSFDELKLLKVSYRPFDDRWIYFDKKLVWRHRGGVMQHFLRDENVGLVSARGTKNRLPDHFFVSQTLMETKLGESSTQSYIFPLYLYHDDGARTPNFNTAELARITANLSAPVEPEEILDYIYGVLHSPAYREQYKEFLKTDFPRVPIPSGDAEFAHYSGYGNKLRELHLMVSAESQQLITSYPVAGDNVVEKPAYRDGKIWINQTQFFGDVPPVAWEFYIGGYQPAQKWLKDRKGRALDYDDINHYQRVIKVLTETERLMQQIDQTASFA